MQPSFYHANSSILLKNISWEIKRAIQDKSAIVFVEYKSAGSTLYDLKKLVNNYPMWDLAIKNTDCGAIEVLDTIEKAGYNKRRLRICGVNIECCVKDTIIKLAKLLPETKIEVIREACNGNQHDFSWVYKIRNCVLEISPNFLMKEEFIYER